MDKDSIVEVIDRIKKAESLQEYYITDNIKHLNSIKSAIDKIQDVKLKNTLEEHYQLLTKSDDVTEEDIQSFKKTVEEQITLILELYKEFL